jgi:hypothetical protein
MTLDRSLTESLPPKVLRERLGATLREADLLRRLLPLAERAERYRQTEAASANTPTGRR